MFASSYGPGLTQAGGLTFVPGYGPVLYDGLGAPVCVPGISMVIV